jgi:hypothetical protein
MPESSLYVRGAQSHNSLALDWLARLDGRPRPVGPVLLAERDGVPVAAIALTSGAVVADPCTPSQHAVGFLRFLRYRIMRQGGQSDAARSLLRRAGSYQVATKRTDHAHGRLPVAA